VRQAACDAPDGTVTFSATGVVLWLGSE